METRSRGRHAIALFLALAVTAPLGLGACGGSDGPSGPGPSTDPPPPPPPPPPGPDFDFSGNLLAFRLTTSTSQNIWLANLDELVAINLTDHPSANSDPAWSPDGSRLAFVSDRSGNSDLWVINADGTGLTQMTSNQGNVRFPDWSPDGTMIAYSANVGGQRDLYVVAAPGANASLLAIHPALADGPVQVTDDPATDNEPVWTPDGSGFYFFSSRNNCSGIHHLTFDATTTDNEPVRLSFDFAFDCTFTCAPGKGFSPLAARHVITFVSDDDGDDDIYVVEIDPSDPTKVSSPKKVTDSQADEFYSTWAQPQPNPRLANDPATGFAGSVSSEQSWVFFDSNRTGRWQLWSSLEDGTGVARITNAVSNHQMPRFRPATGSGAIRPAGVGATITSLDDLPSDPAASDRIASPPGVLYDLAGDDPGGRSCEREAY